MRRCELLSQLPARMLAIEFGKKLRRSKVSDMSKGTTRGKIFGVPGDNIVRFAHQGGCQQRLVIRVFEPLAIAAALQAGIIDQLLLSPPRPRLPPPLLPLLPRRWDTAAALCRAAR